MDPRVKLGLTFCAGLVAVSLERPLSLGLFALACGLPLALLRVEARWWRRGLVAAAALVWSCALSQGLFYAQQPRVPLVSLGPLVLYREGVTYGLAQSLRLVGVTLSGLALAVSTPPDRMYAALLALRIPFGLALMAATALRFVPELGREFAAVRRARAHRGRPAWRRGPGAWLALEVSLLRPVVARAWRRAQNLAESLDARGFDPLAPRAVRRPLSMGAGEAALLAGVTLLGVGALASRGLYLLYTTDTLYLPALRPLYGFVRAWF
jgi:energy-coupling factor transport system permease protein